MGRVNDVLAPRFRVDVLRRHYEPRMIEAPIYLWRHCCKSFYLNLVASNLYLRSGNALSKKKVPLPWVQKTIKYKI